MGFPWALMGLEISSHMKSLMKLPCLMFSATLLLASPYAVHAADKTFTEGYEDRGTVVLPRFTGGHQIGNQSLVLTGERAHKGDSSLKIEYAFNERGWIVYKMYDALPGGVYPGSIGRGDELSFYTYSKASDAMVNLQMIDARGEYFQINYPLTGRGWQKRKLVVKESGFPHKWDGDGKIDFPLSEINLTINVEKADSGTVYLDDFAVKGKDVTNEWPPFDYTEGGKYSQERVDAALALKNREILDLPIVDAKHVLAHNMATLFDEKTPELAFLVREHFDVNGSTADLGGYIQYLPYIDYREGSPLGPRNPVEAAKVEIQAAMACGLTGFQFYYPYGEDAMLDDYTRTITAHFTAAEELGVDFTFTLCFSNANHDETEAEKIARWARHTKAMIESTPEKYWLKTPDGRHIFFTWMADGLADEVGHAWNVQNDAEQLKFAALAYENLAAALGVEAAWVYFFLKLDEEIDPDYTSAMLDYFPAVWPWCQFDYRSHEDNRYDAFAAETIKRGRAFCYSASLDFYSSKTYPTDTWDLIFDIKKAKQLGVHGQYRHYMELELTRAFRLSLDRAMDMDTGIINVVTWNDYAEGHHLAPDTNHNFAFAMILNYYKNKWMDPAYEVEKEQAAVFFKKYQHDAKPVFDYEIHVEGIIEPSMSDYIEVVTLLKEPASVIINGKEAGAVTAGIDAVRIPSETGPVSFSVVRDGKEVLSLKATEAITDKPYRTDRHTYGYSTVEEDYIQRIFGDDRRSILPSREYATDVDKK
jgi:hypothetical protein